jgi:hypothetical protein
MARILRPPSRVRWGRLSWPGLLSVLSICALVGLAGWLAWIRFAHHSSDNVVLPDTQEAAQPNTPPAPEADEPTDDGVFLRDNFEEKISATTLLVGLGAQGSTAAAGELALMRVGEKRRLWLLGPPESAPMLRPNLLKNIHDDLPVASGKTGKKWDEDEFEVYLEALAKASYTPPAAFANSARRNLTYEQLFNEPGDYRGDVIHVEGRLKRLRRFNPPAAVAERISDLYEGWIFAKERGADPVCLIFTELPPGLSVGEKMETPVAFDGYYFKRYAYKAADSGPNQSRRAPLLIGRTIILGGPSVAATPEGESWSKQVLIVFFVMLVITVGLAAAMTWWFRHADRRVRRRVAGAMAVPFQVEAESDSTPAAPSVASESGPNQNTTDATPIPTHPLSPTRFTLDRGESGRGPPQFI